jgi:NAD(P)-dependent dehydrogenase (short-subunit alcohol dehydrogenase family)
MDTNVLAVGAATAAAAVAYFYLTAEPERKQVGPKGTEGLLNPGDKEYDEKITELWGGPPPKHFESYLKEWSSSHKVEGKKVCLITGGTGGIGFYVAKLLAHLGYELILPARTGFESEATGSVAAIKAAVPGAIITVPNATLDLQSLQSVRVFSKNIRDDFACIDLLCLNAGRGGSKGDDREETTDGVEAIVQVNAVSHFLLTSELLPLLQKSSAARVISQSSIARLCNCPGLKESADAKVTKLADLNGTDKSDFNAFHQYQLSKACNVFFTIALNKRLKAAGVDNVTAVVTDPGFAATGVNIQHNLGHSFLGMPNGTVNTKTLHGLAGAHHAADGALTMVMACIDKDVKRNDWFTPTKNGVAGSAAGPPAKGDPANHKDACTDPLNFNPDARFQCSWPNDSHEVFWKQAMGWTDAKWNGLF